MYATNTDSIVSSFQLAFGSSNDEKRGRMSVQKQRRYLARPTSNWLPPPLVIPLLSYIVLVCLLLCTGIILAQVTSTTPPPPSTTMQVKFKIIRNQHAKPNETSLDGDSINNMAAISEQLEASESSSSQSLLAPPLAAQQQQQQQQQSGKKLHMFTYDISLNKRKHNQQQKLMASGLEPDESERKWHQQQQRNNHRSPIKQVNYYNYNYGQQRQQQRNNKRTTKVPSLFFDDELEEQIATTTVGSDHHPHRENRKQQSTTTADSIVTTERYQPQVQTTLDSFSSQQQTITPLIQQDDLAKFNNQQVDSRSARFKLGLSPQQTTIRHHHDRESSYLTSNKDLTSSSKRFKGNLSSTSTSAILKPILLTSGIKVRSEINFSKDNNQAETKNLTAGSTPAESSIHSDSIGHGNERLSKPALQSAKGTTNRQKIPITTGNSLELDVATTSNDDDDDDQQELDKLIKLRRTTEFAPVRLFFGLNDENLPQELAQPQSQAQHQLQHQLQQPTATTTAISKGFSFPSTTTNLVGNRIGQIKRKGDNNTNSSSNQDYDEDNDNDQEDETYNNNGNPHTSGNNYWQQQQQQQPHSLIKKNQHDGYNAAKDGGGTKTVAQTSSSAIRVVASDSSVPLVINNHGLITAAKTSLPMRRKWQQHIAAAAIKSPHNTNKRTHPTRAQVDIGDGIANGIKSLAPISVSTAFSFAKRPIQTILTNLQTDSPLPSSSSSVYNHQDDHKLDAASSNSHTRSNSTGNHHLLDDISSSLSAIISSGDGTGGRKGPEIMTNLSSSSVVDTEQQQQNSWSFFPNPPYKHLNLSSTPASVSSTSATTFGAITTQRESQWLTSTKPTTSYETINSATTRKRYESTTPIPVISTTTTTKRPSLTPSIPAHSNHSLYDLSSSSSNHQVSGDDSGGSNSSSSVQDSDNEIKPHNQHNNSKTNNKKSQNLRHKLQKIIRQKFIVNKAVAGNGSKSATTAVTPTNRFQQSTPPPLLSSTMANNMANLLSQSLGSLMNTAQQQQQQLIQSQSQQQQQSSSLLRPFLTPSRAGQRLRQRLGSVVTKANANYGLNRRATSVGSLLFSGFIYGLSVLPALMAITGVNPLNNGETMSSASSDYRSRSNHKTTGNQKPKSNDQTYHSSPKMTMADTDKILLANLPYPYILPVIPSSGALMAAPSTVAADPHTLESTMGSGSGASFDTTGQDSTFLSPIHAAVGDYTTQASALVAAIGGGGDLHPLIDHDPGNRYSADLRSLPHSQSSSSSSSYHNIPSNTMRPTSESYHHHHHEDSERDSEASNENSEHWQHSGTSGNSGSPTGRKVQRDLSNLQHDNNHREHRGNYHSHQDKATRVENNSFYPQFRPNYQRQHQQQQDDRFLSAHNNHNSAGIPQVNKRHQQQQQQQVPIVSQSQPQLQSSLSFGSQTQRYSEEADRSLSMSPAAAPLPQQQQQHQHQHQQQHSPIAANSVPSANFNQNSNMRDSILPAAQPMAIFVSPSTAVNQQRWSWLPEAGNRGDGSSNRVSNEHYSGSNDPYLRQQQQQQQQQAGTIQSGRQNNPRWQQNNDFVPTTNQEQHTIANGQASNGLDFALPGPYEPTVLSPALPLQQQQQQQQQQQISPLNGGAGLDHHHSGMRSRKTSSTNSMPYYNRMSNSFRNNEQPGEQSPGYHRNHNQHYDSIVLGRIPDKSVDTSYDQGGRNSGHNTADDESWPWSRGQQRGTINSNDNYNNGNAAANKDGQWKAISQPNARSTGGYNRNTTTTTNDSDITKPGNQSMRRLGSEAISIQSRSNWPGQQQQQHQQQSLMDGPEIIVSRSMALSEKK